ncbi:hypothetical protein CRUP_014612, partial [Coryphaenoides rupestris]
MSSLASKDSYIQKLASKICARDHEPRNSKFVHFRGDGEGASKNSKRKQKRLNRQKAIGDQKNAPQSKPAKSATSSPAAPAAAAKTKASKKVANGKKVKDEIKGEIKDGSLTLTFTAVDLLRKRLHEKIEESKGQ